MSKKNEDFFKKKNSWSEVKDELLGCYFKPYISKILHTRRPIIFVDCFAGKGKFNDGKNGSPLIALEIIDECLKTTKIERTIVHTYFIELNHAEDLRKNLTQYGNAIIIHGKYESNINCILKDKKGCNIFLYLDPYGIKALQCSFFEQFSNSNFYSIELLMNMNSFGFVREACHALGTSYDDVDVFDDLIEYDTTTMDASLKSIDDLNNIAGGDYWKRIIEGYKAKEYDGYIAEQIFAMQYCRKLQNSYKYVLNMPIRIKQGQRPKYRMIHATNHEEGCLLMANNIWNRWQALQDIQNSGQLLLWQENTENQTVDEKNIEEKLKKHILQYTTYKPLNIILSAFFVEHGVLCSTGIIYKMLASLERDGAIEILREPPTTPKGTKSSFFTENRSRRVSLRSNL